MKYNPFKVYDGPEDVKKAREYTRKIKKLWNEFKDNVASLQKEYEDVGASDTVSREELCDWVKEKHGELF